MIRLSEEQRAIIGCFSGTKEEVIFELKRGIVLIEDDELREESEALLEQLEKMTDTIFEEAGKSLLDL